MENTPNFNSGLPSRFESSPDSTDKTKSKDKSKAKSKDTSTSWNRSFKPKSPSGLFETKPNRDSHLESKEKSEPPLEKLSVDEKQTVARDYLRQRGEDVQGELDKPKTSGEEAASLANAALLDQVNEQLDSGAMPDPETLDQAFNDTAESLGLDPAELNDNEQLPGDSETADLPESDETLEPNEYSDEESLEPTGPSAAPEFFSPDDNTGEVASDDELNSETTNSNNAGPGGQGGSGSGGGSGGGGHGPGSGGYAGGAGPRGPAAGFGAGPAMGGGNRVGGPDILPLPTPNIDRLVRPERRHGHLKYVVAGGIVGYLLGRRRGRINTEKKLLPVQHKLEKEVTGLQEQIAEREVKIRRLARQQAERQPTLKEQIVSNLDNRRQLKTIEKPKELPIVEISAAETVPLANASQTEHLGQLALQPERSADGRRVAAEQMAGQVIGSREFEPVIRVETAPLEQVLKLAEDIKIEQQDLRQLYQAGRVEQKDLRRVIEAYVKGERYDQLLSESLKPLVSQEYLTKTAAGLRQQAGNSGGSSSSPSGSPHLEQLVRQASLPNQLDIDPTNELLRRPSKPSQSAGLKALPLILLAAILLTIFWLILK